MAKRDALSAIDKQIITWVEQLDRLYRERNEVTHRISDIEERLSSMKQARRALAAEWGDESQEIPIPLRYTSEGVRDAIHEVFGDSKENVLTVDQLVARLVDKGFNFGDKNPRRVVNMALINDPEVEPDGKGKYKYEEYIDLPF